MKQIGNMLKKLRVQYGNVSDTSLHMNGPAAMRIPHGQEKEYFPVSYQSGIDKEDRCLPHFALRPGVSCPWNLISFDRLYQPAVNVLIISIELSDDPSSTTMTSKGSYFDDSTASRHFPIVLAAL